MPFRICSGNNKILISHLTFYDAIKANPCLERKDPAYAAYGRPDNAWGEGKDADRTSDDQLGGQASCQTFEEHVWIKQPPSKQPGLCAVCLLSLLCV